MMGNKYIVLLTCMYTDLQTHLYPYTHTHRRTHAYTDTNTKTYIFSQKHACTHAQIHRNACTKRTDRNTQTISAITNILILERIQMYENKHWPPTQFSKHTHNCTVSAAALLSQ